MFEALIWVLFYGIIEGITEWLPVSSTGHLILFENFWQLDGNICTDSFLEFFRVVIQLGAIMAVVISYFHRLNPFSSKLSERGKKRVWGNWIRIIVGCIPAGVAGLLLNDFFDEYFYTWQVVAATLIIYGIIFIIVENRQSGVKAKYSKMEELPLSIAFFIGCFQILALIPGTSRSGVTIIAGLLLGASRLAATDFTFCMAIPVMAGASLLKMVKYLTSGNSFTGRQILILFVGLIVAFVVSIYAVRFIQKFISKNNFKPFGIYRIILGVLIIALALIFPGILPGSSKEPSKYGLPDYVDEEYIEVNSYSRPDIPLLEVNDIVIHYTANPGSTAMQNRDYFDGLKNQSGDDATYGSSNFIVGLEGEVIAVVPIDEIAYCSNNRNSDTISIETCHPDETGKFNDATYESLVNITAWLCDHYGLDSSHVIRHYDVTGKICPKYFVENEDAWAQFKEDVDSAIKLLQGDTVTETTLATAS